MFTKNAMFNFKIFGAYILIKILVLFIQILYAIADFTPLLIIRNIIKISNIKYSLRKMSDKQ